MTAKTTAAAGPAGNFVITQTTVTTTTVTTRIPPGALSAVLTAGTAEITIAIPGWPLITVPASSPVVEPGYPIIAPVVAAGKPITLGAGPDVLQFNMANNPASPGVQSQFSILVDGVEVLTGITLTSNAGASSPGGQVVTLLNALGAGPHAVTFQGEGAGLADCFWNFVTWNGVAYATSGQESIYNGNHVQTVAWAPAAAVVPPPPPPAPSMIPATISVNGIAAELVTDTLANLCAKTPAGGTLKLSPGHWFGSANVPAGVTIDLGGGTIDGAGYLALASGKALICPMGPGVHVQNGTLTHAGCLSLNGAGIREEGPGCDWTASNVTILQCQMGVLTEGSNVTMTGSTTEDCGWDGTAAGAGAAGLSHNLYFNQGTTAAVTVTLVGHISIGGAYTTHEGKFRCDAYLSGTCTFSATVSGADAATIQGSVIDAPNGGVFVMNAGTIALPPDTAGQDTQFFTFGAEIGSPGIVANPGASATFAGVAFVGAGIIQSAIGGTLDVTGSTGAAVTLTGWGGVVGTISAAA